MRERDFLALTFDEGLTGAQAEVIGATHIESHRQAMAAQGDLAAQLCGSESSSQVHFESGAWRSTAPQEPLWQAIHRRNPQLRVRGARK